MEVYEKSSLKRGTKRWARHVWDCNPQLTDGEKFLALQSVVGYWKAMEWSIEFSGI